MMFRKGSPCERSPSMKKLALMSFVLGPATSLLVLAQETAKPGEMKQDTPKAEKTSAKAMNLFGKIGDDGKTFVDKAGRHPIAKGE
jgi:hypothetical protein